jgi:hypothetical protein
MAKDRLNTCPDLVQNIWHVSILRQRQNVTRMFFLSEVRIVFTAFLYSGILNVWKESNHDYELYKS